MKKINKQSDLLIDCTENFYKIMWSMIMTMTLYVIFLLNMLMKQEMNLPSKYEHKKKLKFFSYNELNFQPKNQNLFKFWY